MQKVFAVTAYFLAYAAWILVACIPFLIDTPNSGAVSLAAIEATPHQSQDVGPRVEETVHVTFDTLCKKEADPQVS